MMTSGFERRNRAARDAGYSLVELLVATALLGLVMGATMTAIVSARRVNESVMNLTDMNKQLRAAMDMMVRDMLQVASGLPSGHVISIPSGDGATPVRLPGPIGTAFVTDPAVDAAIPAVLPRPGAGPIVNGRATDVVTILMADNTFTDIPLTAVTSTSVTVAMQTADGEPIDLTGADRVIPGQLMLIEKGSISTLVQVTAVDTGTRRLTFGAGDSLNLNQTSGAGTLAALNAAPPANEPANTRISRVRMISYYLDTTIPNRPRLMRRINNGDPVVFNNELGTVLAFDVENLELTYDLDNDQNDTNVRFTAADLAGNGACAPDPCGVNQIRKVNIALTGRSSNARGTVSGTVYRNTLTTQVSLRGMAFVDEYKAPEP